MNDFSSLDYNDLWLLYASCMQSYEYQTGHVSKKFADIQAQNILAFQRLMKELREEAESRPEYPSESS